MAGIEFRNVSKSFGTYNVIQHLDVTIQDQILRQLRELEKDRLRDGYDFYSDQEADIWN